MSSTLAEGQPRTIVTPGTGGQSLTAQLPLNGRFVVESVIATIDASGSGNATAELSIDDGSGVVIANKRQGEVIPAGGSGTATWALRLSDDGGGATGPTLKTTDGVTTVNPTTELDIGPRIALANLGGGKAGLTVAPQTLNPTRFVTMVARCTVPDISVGSVAPLWRGAGYRCWTNDVPAVAGYNTVGGAPLAGAFTGDHFNTTAMQNPTDAIAINDNAPGVYLYQFGWTLWPPDPGMVFPCDTFVAALQWISSIDPSRSEPVGMIPFNVVNGFGNARSVRLTGPVPLQAWGPQFSGHLFKQPQSVAHAQPSDSLGFWIGHNGGGTILAIAYVSLIRVSQEIV